MKKIYIFSAIATLLLACQNNNANHNTAVKDSISNKPTSQPQQKNLDAQSAKEWLQAQIIKYFDDTNLSNEDLDMRSITTPEYYEFKMDAMNVELESEGSMSQQEFEHKWKEKYDLKTHPLHVGFLISGQDFGDIVVEKCELKKENKDLGTFLFHTVILDKDYNVRYDRDIKVLRTVSTFLIADVIERE